VSEIAARPVAAGCEAEEKAFVPHARTGVAGPVITVVAGTFYFVALHLLIADRQHPHLLFAVALAPLVCTALARASRSSGRWLLCIVAAVGAGGWLLDRWAVPGIERALLVENVLFDLFVAGVFAITLFGPREALVTRLARAQRGGTLPPAALRYTRRVTAAWALFFMLAAIASTVLFATVSIATWSMCVNLLIWPAIAAMFALEYAVRRLALPGLRHTSPLAGAQAFLRRDAIAGDARDAPVR